MFRAIYTMLRPSVAALLLSLAFAAGGSLCKADSERGPKPFQITPPEDRGYLRHPLRVMNRVTYDAYHLDPESGETATISYSVSKTGWVRIRLVRRDNQDVVLRTLQQWTESHYDNKKKHSVVWNGRDASGNRIDPKRMLVLFETRDNRIGGAHESHDVKSCKDPELTAAEPHRAKSGGSKLSLVAEMEEAPFLTGNDRGFELRVYLDGTPIDTLQFPAKSRRFTYSLSPHLLSPGDHTVTFNVDDFDDHIGTAHFQLRGPDELTAESVAQTAPNFSLPDLLGHKQSLADYQGELVLVNFWATSCPSCIHEMPTLQSLQNALNDRDFVVVAIAGDAAGEWKVKPMVDSLGLNFPVLLDPDSQVADLYRVRVRPTSYLIDSDGFLVARILGERDWMTEEHRAWIETLLPQPLQTGD